MTERNKAFISQILLAICFGAILGSLGNKVGSFEFWKTIIGLTLAAGLWWWWFLRRPKPKAKEDGDEG